jgi:hypothetical protein
MIIHIGQEVYHSPDDRAKHAMTLLDNAFSGQIYVMALVPTKMPMEAFMTHNRPQQYRAEQSLGSEEPASWRGTRTINLHDPAAQRVTRKKQN